jgi:SAM-dependent methyltransferase
MPDTVFGSAYADAYDILYRDKDYQAECDLIETCMRRFLPDKPKAILDVGCGTGNHTINLVRRGYRVHGVDSSAAMLDTAREKLRALRGSIPDSSVAFSSGDMADFRLGETFDLAIMMFAVLGYQITNERLMDTLRNLRCHLRLGALLVSDFWYGPAVLATRPSERVRDICDDGRRIIRSVRTDLDTLRHVARVDFHVWTLDETRLLSETREIHEMRFFFPQELRFILKESGFEIASLSAFPSLDAPVGESTWNALLIARAV